MYWQNEYFRQNVSMTLNNTWREDLPKYGLLGSLMIWISGTTVIWLGLNGGSWRICDFISKIEIIGDGATVIKSLSAKQAKALAFFDQKISMPDAYKNAGAVTQRDYTLINFGRYLGDLEYGLDLSRFKNVEIRITNTASAAEYADLTISVMMNILRDAVPGQFKGYMHSEAWRSWVPVASEVQYLQLPSNWLIRRIMLQPVPGIDAATGAWYTFCNNLMYNIELAFMTGNERVWKDSWNMLVNNNLVDYGAYVFGGGSMLVNANYSLDVGMGNHLYKAGIAEGQAAARGTVPTTDATTYAELLDFKDYAGLNPIFLMEIGMAPHNCGVFRFDHDMNPATWLDTKAKDVVKLDITTRSTATCTSANNYVVLDRLVR